MAKSPEEEHPKKAIGWAARDSSGVLSPFKFSRRLLIFDINSFFFRKDKEIEQIKKK